MLEIHRVHYHYAPLEKDSEEKTYKDNQQDQYKVVLPPEANLCSSLIAAPEQLGGMHAPVIDFDIPIEVYPSSKVGHHHLYINHPITWDKYQKVLTALADAGLVEKGYAMASINKGYSAVRPVGVVKPTAPKGVNVLKENALLRRTIYELRKEIAALKDSNGTTQTNN